MFCTRWNARTALLIEASDGGGARRRGVRVFPLRRHSFPLLPHVTPPAHTPRLAHVCHSVMTRGRHPALKQVAGVSILRRWRGGRAANCTGLENRRVFTHVGSNPTPSARERRSRRRGCYSNPGWRLRASPSPHLRRRCAAPRLRIPPPVAFRPAAGQPAFEPKVEAAVLRILCSPSARGPGTPATRCVVGAEAASQGSVEEFGIERAATVPGRRVWAATHQHFTKEVQPCRSCDPSPPW